MRLGWADPIDPLPENRAEARLFHAGTRAEQAELMTAGGRVFCATALGESLKEAQAQAYRLADAVRFSGCQYRRDIGHRGLSSS